jgi:hypothetical protein
MIIIKKKFREREKRERERLSLTVGFSAGPAHPRVPDACLPYGLELSSAWLV